MSLDTILQPLALITIPVALFMIVDSRRRLRHLKVALRLIDDGVPESEARQRSGASHWDLPFYVRIWRDYPALPR